MKLWHRLALFLGLLGLCFFVPLVGVPLMFVFVLWHVWRFYRRHAEHSGPLRIRHGLLRGSLVSRYGMEEGMSLYKKLVEALNKKGFR